MAYALSFDGTDDYASAGRVTTAEPGANEDFTVAARFKHNGTTVFGYPAIIVNYVSGAGYYLYLFSTSIYAGIDIGGTQQLEVALADRDDWHNAALIRRSDNLYLYLDGTENGPLAGFTKTGAISNASMEFMLGRFVAGDSDGHLNGLISKAAYWASSGRTAAQLDTWFAASDVTTGSPTHAWALNEGTGTTTADAVASADFTLTGATWEALPAATEIVALLPVAVLASSNMQDSDEATPPARMADIQDDPEAIDAFGFSLIDPAEPGWVRLSLQNPSTALVGTQTFQATLFRDATYTADATIALYEDGALVRTLIDDQPIASTTGTLFEPTWTASEIAAAADVEIRIDIVPNLPRTFTVDPAVSGRTTWDLDEHGPMTVNGSGTWTITPSAGFSGSVALWGGGGGSGGHGATTAGNGGNGGNTTFSGQTANGGALSLGRTNNTAGTGGNGGTASGGDTNTTGSAGGTATIGNTSTGGAGGASPNGGGTAAGTSGTNGVSTAGNAGNPPGGGASGGARGSTGGTTAQRRGVGGGGGGGYSVKAYALGALTAGTPITLTVGGAGAAGTGDQSAGSAGAAGRATIT